MDSIEAWYNLRVNSLRNDLSLHKNRLIELKLRQDYIIKSMFNGVETILAHSKLTPSAVSQIKFEAVRQSDLFSLGDWFTVFEGDK